MSKKKSKQKNPTNSPVPTGYDERADDGHTRCGFTSESDAPDGVSGNWS